MGGYLGQRTGRLAAFMGTGKPMELREYPLPQPAPSALLARVRRANICGTDIHTWVGELDPAKLGRRLPRSQGHEGVGVVDQLGAALTTDSAGDPVGVGDRIAFRYFSACGACAECAAGRSRCCPSAGAELRQTCDEWPHFKGAFAEYVYLGPRPVFFNVPVQVPDELAAAANCAVAQGFCALDVGQFTWGQDVAIVGAGGLGLFLTAIARDHGARRVILVDRAQQRAELGKAFGATDIVAEQGDAAVAAVGDLTGGRGPHLVIEVAGTPAAVPTALAMTAIGGRCVTMGNVAPGFSCDLDPSLLVLGNRSLLGAVLYEPRHLHQALQWLAMRHDSYDWGPLTGREYPLGEVNQAFEAQVALRAVRTGLRMSAV